MSSYLVERLLVAPRRDQTAAIATRCGGGRIWSRAAFGAGGSQVLVKEAATEAVVESRPLVDYRVLHLAAHGIMSTKFPARSALVLRPAGGEDGLLQAREILDLRVNAALVTLSAWTRALLFHFERCFISALLPARSVRP